MADFGKWFSNPLTQGLKNEAADAQRKARAAQNEAEIAQQRARAASSREDDTSDALLKAKHELIDKNSEIRKLKQKLEETEAHLQKKFNVLKEWVLSQSAWKAVAQKLAAENGIEENHLQEQLDKAAIDHVEKNPTHGLETTERYKDAMERLNSKQQNLI